MGRGRDQRTRSFTVRFGRRGRTSSRRHAWRREMSAVSRKRSPMRVRRASRFPRMAGSSVMTCTRSKNSSTPSPGAPRARSSPRCSRLARASLPPPGPPQETLRRQAVLPQARLNSRAVHFGAAPRGVPGSISATCRRMFAIRLLAAARLAASGSARNELHRVHPAHEVEGAGGAPGVNRREDVGRCLRPCPAGAPS